MIYRSFGKRCVDLTLAIVLVLIASPLMMVIAVAVRLGLGSPVLFRQERAGRFGKPFHLVKFRTMTNECDRSGQPLPDEYRMTNLGRFLRSSSLDELPALVNVLRGDMSLVGPRPLYLRYIRRYTAEQSRRLEVLPGITGLAQVSGRNALPWSHKFALDVQYVDHLGLWLDVKILAWTMIRVLARQGITQEGHVTAQEFTGCDGFPADGLP